MRRIDLTVDGVFSKNNLTTINVPQNKKLTSSEITANFLTGSISEINSNKFILSIARSVDSIEPRCDRCGHHLFDNRDTLCSRCNREMDEDNYNKKIISLIMSY